MSLVRYSEDEPRDDQGRWTDGGDSGGDSSGGGSSGSIPHEAAGLPTAGAKVDGLTVDDHIPNTGSIDSTFASENDYTVLTGVREVPFSAFGSGGGKPSFYSASEKARVEALAEQIKESGNIQPLIVVYEQHNLKEGPYVLEGGHRFDALRLLEKTKFPALVVVDHVTGAKKSFKQVHYSNEKVFGQSGDLIRAKRDCNGDVVLYVDAIALDYADPQQGIKEYLNCFRSMQTLYVRRDLQNGFTLAEWAKGVGFETTLLPQDMHVTIAFSRTPVDWAKVGSAPQSLIVPASSDRSILALGIEKDAVVLKFISPDLQKRWQQLRDIGASWDWPDYQSHITITFKSNGIDLAAINPYDGPLVFGPEIFQEVKDDWKSGVEERYSEDQPRNEDGEWTDGGGGSGGGGGSDSSSGGDGGGSSDVSSDGAYNDKGQWGEGPLLDQKPKTQIIETGETKKKEKVALVYASTPIPEPHPQGGFTVKYQRSYAVHIRKGHYDGKVPGGIRYSWFVHKQYLSKPDATKIFARRTKKDFSEERYSEDQPRDDDGKWTDGGGGDGGSEGGTSGGEGPAAGDGAVEIPKSPLVDAIATHYSSTEMKVMEDYSSWSYEEMNFSMRHGFQDPGTEKSLREQINQMKLALDKTVLKGDIILYRGVSGNTGEKLYATAEKLVGQELPLGGFQSTSTSKDGTAKFSTVDVGDSTGKMLMEIHVAKGVHAIDMNTVIAARGESPDQEQEVVLNPGTIMITEVQRIKDTTIIIGTYAEK